MGMVLIFVWELSHHENISEFLWVYVIFASSIIERVLGIDWHCDITLLDQIMRLPRLTRPPFWYTPSFMTKNITLFFVSLTVRKKCKTERLENCHLMWFLFQYFGLLNSYSKCCSKVILKFWGIFFPLFVVVVTC